MKPPPFEYFAPQLEVSEALELLQQYGEEARILAGGQSLLPLMSLRLARPTVIIDINRLSSLGHISLEPNGELTSPPTSKIRSFPIAVRWRSVDWLRELDSEC